MPPDVTALDPATAARAAHARWCELRDLYDALDAHLEAAAWASAAVLVPRIESVAAALATLAATTVGSRDGADRALWTEADAIAAGLAKRQARALGVVTGARDVVAAELARVHVTRGHAARYGDGPRSSLFSSRIV